MTYLLDTHVLLWFRIDPEQLGPKTLRLLQNRKTSIALSVVSALELAQLDFKKRIELGESPDAWFNDSARHFNCRPTRIDPEICAAAYQLPGNFHADPADRLLVATARALKYTLVTADRRLLGQSCCRTRNAAT